ncbi:hypothetical protein ACPPVQ_08665 [Diaminobutyricibacter sp. McL0618]|uniref:hypothetical protein n=1 Tax=Leifsonia sp. McL0618 TaxID=3415677 RepID=UPI003CED6F87
MSEDQMKRAAEWFLTLQEIPLEDTDRPALYDTGLSADDGLWTRSGWAGRA